MSSIALCHHDEQGSLLQDGHWVLAVWFPVALGFTTWLLTLPFCGRNKVGHFFCGICPVLKLVCANTALFELLILIAIVIIAVIPFCLIAISYFAPLHYPCRSLDSFSCGPEVSLFHLCSSPGGSDSFPQRNWHHSPATQVQPLIQHEKIISLSYTVVTHMLNPIICSLRNQEVKQSLRRCILEVFSNLNDSMIV